MGRKSKQSRPPHAGANAEAQEQERGASSHGIQPSQGFLFVPSTGQKDMGGDRQALRSLRAHVMHNYLDKERRDVPRPPAARPITGQKMRFRLRPDGLEQRFPHRYRKNRSEEEARAEDGSQDRGRRAIHANGTGENAVTGVESLTSMLLPFGDGKFDPFNVLPVEIDPSDEVLVDRFQNYERWPWCPINGQGMWSPFALSDQLVFHATMYSWGMHFRARFSGQEGVYFLNRNPEIIRHKLAAISMINARLSDPQQAVRDETLAAVAALTNMELVFGTKDEATKHMNGLQVLVNMRGGLLSMDTGVQLLLQRLISWNDLIYSELFDEALKFPPIEIWDQAWRTYQQPSLPGSLPGLARSELRAAGVPHHEVLSILEAMRQLCHAEQVSPLARLGEQGRMQRGDMFHQIERRLRLIIQATASPMADRWNATVWRTVALTALIFVHHYLRGNPLRYRNFEPLVMQLHETLLTMDHSLQELGFAPALLVWVFSVGSVASTGSHLHNGFLAQLELACVRYGLVDWDRLRHTLSHFLWVGLPDEDRYFNVWQEVNTLMQVRSAEKYSF